MQRKVSVLAVATALTVFHSLPCANAGLLGPAFNQATLNHLAFGPIYPLALESASNEAASWTKLVLTPEYMNTVSAGSFGRMEGFPTSGKLASPAIAVIPVNPIEPVVSAAVPVSFSPAAALSAFRVDEKPPQAVGPQSVVPKVISKQAKSEANVRNGKLPPVKIALPGFPHTMEPAKERLNLNTPSLAPMAFVRFCMQYSKDCEVRRMAFRPHMIKITEARWSELTQVNREVNRAISPQANEAGVLAEEWLISPRTGDCNDYAVTKRHELLDRGWPSRSLLLTEVVLPSGEHHLILVVRTESGDFALDNLAANIRPVSQIHYGWVRAQSEKNPRFWASVNFAKSDRVAMLVRKPVASAATP